MALQPNQINIVSDALTVKAAAAVTKYRFIGYNGQHCAANAAAIGVSYFDAATGDPITVYGAGNIVPLEASAAFVAGALLASDAAGKGITATLSDLTHTVNAMALQAATAAGDIVSVLVW